MPLAGTFLGQRWLRRWNDAALARSAIQMLALAITQHEKRLAQREDGLVGEMIVPDHDWIRGREEDV
jgi:hypothetical protein